MVGIVYILNLDAKIWQDEFLLPACYVYSGLIKIQGIKYDDAIFLSIPVIYRLVEENSWESLEEGLKDCVEHEVVHSLIEWKHGSVEITV